MSDAEKAAVPVAKPRVFTTMNHPEPDEDGVQYYTVYEVFPDDGPGSIMGNAYVLVENKLTDEQAATYINAHGVHQDA